MYSTGITRYDNLQIDFSLTGPGWCELIISTEDWSTAIYGSNAGGNLVDLMHELVKLYPLGKSSCKVDFDDDPDMSSMTVTRVDEKSLPTDSVLLVEVESAEAEEDLYKFEIKLSQFAKAIVMAIDRLLDELGFVGYTQLWGTGKGIDVGAYITLKRLVIGAENGSGSKLEEEIELIKMRLE